MRGGYGLTLYLFVVGLVVGSFLNVCICRIPQEQSIAYPRSHCMSCGNKIKWYDMIPILSWIMLKGKCRYCGERISFRYPLVELMTGGLFTALYMHFGLSLQLVKFMVFASVMLVIGMIDFDTTDVYSSTVYFGFVAGVVFLAIGFFYGSNPVQYVIGAAIGGGAISLIIFLTKGMGWGDAEIAAICGLFLGTRLMMLIFFIASITGGLVGTVLVVTKIKSRKDYIPFGPFLATSAIFVLFFGNGIMTWYLNHFIMPGRI